MHVRRLKRFSIETNYNLQSALALVLLPLKLDQTICLGLSLRCCIHSSDLQSFTFYGLITMKTQQQHPIRLESFQMNRMNERFFIVFHI